MSAWQIVLVVLAAATCVLIGYFAAAWLDSPQPGRIEVDDEPLTHEEWRKARMEEFKKAAAEESVRRERRAAGWLATLPPYSGLDAACPKCATTEAAYVAWQAGQGSFASWASAEHFARECPTCGYEWNERAPEATS